VPEPTGVSVLLVAAALTRRRRRQDRACHALVAERRRGLKCGTRPATWRRRHGVRSSRL